MYGMWQEEIAIADDSRRPAFPCVGDASGDSNSEVAQQAKELQTAQQLQDLQAEVAELRRTQAAIYRSFFEAAQVQRRLCAPRELRLGDFEIAGEIFPVRHLSGDFFKVFELEGALGVIVGDIAGKGLSAGIWMPHLVSLLHSHALAHKNPADVLAHANRALCSGCGESPLVAAFFARIDLLDGAVHYCNAGLPSPLILRRDNKTLALDAGGPMLGAVPVASYCSGRTQVDPGDTLIAFSDGLTECENTRDEEFETARLLEAARAFSLGSAGQTLFSTLGAVMDFADGRAPTDDLTLLVVRRAALAARSESRGASNAATPGSFLQ